MDAHEDVNTLINQYYTAYAAGDTDTLSTTRHPADLKMKKVIFPYSASM